MRPPSRLPRPRLSLVALVSLVAVALAPLARAEDIPASTDESSTSSTTAPACRPPASTSSTSSTSTTATTAPVCLPPCPTPVPILAAPTSEPAPAALPPLSTTAIPSWGTAKVSDKARAQRVNAAVEAGGIVYLGGQFTKMVPPGGGSSAYRNYLAAIDGATGKLTPWNPKANGKVWAMELSDDGLSVFVGGDFSYIGGVSVSKVAKIDLATGKVDKTFRPKSVKGRVRALALDGARLYLGGEFGSIAGQPRPKLAAVDAATGALLDWTPPPLGPGRYLGHTGIPTPDYAAGHVFAVEAIGGRVFAGGTFLDIGCQAGLVTLDAVSGGLAEPQYDPGRPIFDLDAAGGILYAVGGGPGGRLYAYGPDDDRPLWRAKFDGDAVGVVVAGSEVYVAGHYDFIVSAESSCYQYCPGGPSRIHLAGFSTADGQLLPWNPSADTSTGPYTVAAGANALYVGGEFNKINGTAQPGFAIFPRTP